MTRIPSLRVGFLAAVIGSSPQCYSRIIENESRIENVSRELRKQALIVYGLPPNNGGNNADDSGEVNKGTEGDGKGTYDSSNQETFTFDRPSNSGDFDWNEEETAEGEGGEADRMQILGPECKVGVNIGCISSNDIRCDQLEVPSTQCSIGQGMMNLGIKIISSDCHQSRTTQGDHFFCERKEYQIPDDGAVVEIMCFEEGGNWKQLVHAFAFIGETEINLQNGDGELPKSIMCMIRDSDGNEIQWVTFDTSGTVDLFLKNAFGMIQVESCTVRDRPTQSCKMPVQYNYTVSNLGASPLNLLKVERRRNSDIIDLTPQTPIIELRAGDGTPGEATSVIEDDLLDLCIPEHYETTVTASSDSLRQGSPCFDQSAYAFQFPGIGHMGIDINCISIDGLNCTDLGQKTENCWTPITYTFDVKNVGTTDLLITYVEVLQKGNELDMASFFLDNKILPSEKTSVNYVDHINLCVDGEYETTVTVKAGSTINGNEEGWENFESYPFEIRITPFPTTAPNSEKPTKLPSAVPSPNPSLQPSATSQNPTLISSDGPTNIPTSVPSAIPSLLKSAVPSGIPSILKSGVPSVEPSHLSSTSPSRELSSGPSSSHSNIPTAISSTHPTTVISMVPSTDPTSMPTSNPTPTKLNSPPLIPSEDPTSPPAIDPSKQPTEFPTSSPTRLPTTTPSLIPTATPSSIPSASPTQNPTDQCKLEFDLSCIAPIDVSPDGSCSFNSKQPTVCQEQPSRLKLRYNGGDCTHSSNLQGNTFFICEDYGVNNAGPSNRDGSTVFVRIVDYADNKAIRFDGFVRVGEDITINGMGPNLNVTIYDPKTESTFAEIMKPENILQTLVFHTTCPAPTSNLYLRDRFGAIQIVEFENTRQGIVSSFQQLTLNVEIRSDFEVDLLSTNIVTNIDNGYFGIYNLTNEAFGKRISKSQPFRAAQKVTIDLVRRKAYDAQGVVVGKRTLGNECYGSGATSFVAGAPLPPSIPTVSPTVAPSASAAPSTDPLFTRCDLDASISCTLSDGGSCSDLKAPLGTTCVGKSAEQLSFTYIPSSNCNVTNLQDRFICNDLNLDLKRPFTSFIRVFRGADVFYEGVVTAGQLFRVQLPSNTKEIEASVSTVSSTGSAGTLLEQMQLSVACRKKDDLTLLQKYGHLQLNGFVNENMGSKQIFANLDLTYRVQNNGIFDALLTTATTDSPFTGIADEVLRANAPRRKISPGETLTFSETATLNLVAAVGQDFDFFFEASGVSVFNNFVCSDIGELSLQIG